MGVPGYGDSGERLSLAALVPFLCSLALTLLSLLFPTDSLVPISIFGVWTLPSLLSLFLVLPFFPFRMLFALVSRDNRGGVSVSRVKFKTGSPEL